MDDKDTLYARWLNGELKAEELEELRSSGALKELEAIVKLTDQAGLPKYDTEGALQRLQNNLPKKTTTVLKLKRTWAIGIAASLLLAFSLFFLLQPSATKIEALVSSKITHQFVEGSEVTLNAGSSIKYREDNWENKRVLKLEGEGFFEVQEGAPFIVKTDKGEVEVLGTSFNVRTWGPRLNVICHSGKVSVRGFGYELTLNKGQSVALSSGQSPVYTPITAIKPPWSSGLSKFYNEPLSEVFYEIERQFDVKVEGNIPPRIFTGNFIHGNLEGALRDISRPYGFVCRVSADRKTVFLE